MSTVKELQEALAGMPPDAKIEVLVQQYNKVHPFYLSLIKNSWGNIANNPFPTDNRIVRLYAQLPNTDNTYFVFSERKK